MPKSKAEIAKLGSLLAELREHFKGLATDSDDIGKYEHLDDFNEHDKDRWLREPEKIYLSDEDRDDIGDFFGKPVSMMHFLRGVQAADGHQVMVHKYNDASEARHGDHYDMRAIQGQLAKNGYDMGPVLVVDSFHDEHGPAKPSNRHSFASHVFFRDLDGDIHCYNNYLVLGRHGYAAGLNGQGMRHSQIDSLHKLGVSQINNSMEYDATGSRTGFERPKPGIANPDPKNADHWQKTSYIGGKVWPLFGFGGTIPANHLAKIPPILRKQMKGYDVRDLLDVPGGAKWWSENPHTIFGGYMDTDPESDTRKAHEKAWATISARKGLAKIKESKGSLHDIHTKIDSTVVPPIREEGQHIAMGNVGVGAGPARKSDQTGSNESRTDTSPDIGKNRPNKQSFAKRWKRGVLKKFAGLKNTPVEKPSQTQLAPTFKNKSEEVIATKIPNVAHPDQVRKTLINSGVKPEEMKWSGIDAHLANATGPVKKDDLLNTVRNNPKIGEVLKGGEEPEDIDISLPSRRWESVEDPGYLDEETGEWIYPESSQRRNTATVRRRNSPDAYYDVVHEPEFGNVYVTDADGNHLDVEKLSGDKMNEQNEYSAEEAIKQHEINLAKIPGIDSPAKYERNDLNLPGGQNYREMLLTLPDAGSKKNEDALGGFESPMYHSAHWDEPNVLAHIRFNDRTGPNGEKLLHVEEVQSDWHQKGRDEGYKQPLSEEMISEKASLEKELGDIEKADHDNTVKSVGLIRQWRSEGVNDDEIDRRLEELGGEKNVLTRKSILRSRIREIEAMEDRGVPDAPFKKTWHELAMKRMIRYAAEHGYHGVSWTTGQQQADRYDLIKRIKRVEFDPTDSGDYSQGTIRAYDHNNRPVVGQSGIEPEELDQYIGADAAEKLRHEIKGKEYDRSQWSVDRGSGKEIPLGHYIIHDPNGEILRDHGGGIVHYRNEKDAHNHINALHDADIPQVSGLDLQTGGEMHKLLYDQKIPQFMNAVGKRFGTKVGAVNLNQDHDASSNTEFKKPDRAVAAFERGGEVYGVDQHGHETKIEKLEDIIYGNNWRGFIIGDHQPKAMVHYFPINDAIRHEVLHKGQQRFKKQSAPVKRFSNSNTYNGGGGGKEAAEHFGIVNPSSTGHQGKTELHKQGLYHPVIASNGWEYSHSAPIGYSGGNYYLSHTYKHKDDQNENVSVSPNQNEWHISSGGSNREIRGYRISDLDNALKSRAKTIKARSGGKNGKHGTPSFNPPAEMGNDPKDRDTDPLWQYHRGLIQYGTERPLTAEEVENAKVDISGRHGFYQAPVPHNVIHPLQSQLFRYDPAVGPHQINQHRGPLNRSIEPPEGMTHWVDSPFFPSRTRNLDHTGVENLAQQGEPGPSDSIAYPRAEVFRTDDDRPLRFHSSLYPLQDLVNLSKPGDPYRLFAASILGGNRHAIPNLVRLLRWRDNPAGWWKGWTDLHRRMEREQGDLPKATVLDRLSKITKAAKIDFPDKRGMEYDGFDLFAGNVLKEAEEKDNWHPLRMFADYLDEQGLGHYAELMRSEMANVVHEMKPKPKGNRRFKKEGQVKKFASTHGTPRFNPKPFPGNDASQRKNDPLWKSHRTNQHFWTTGQMGNTNLHVESHPHEVITEDQLQPFKYRVGDPKHLELYQQRMPRSAAVDGNGLLVWNPTLDKIGDGQQLNTWSPDHKLPEGFGTWADSYTHDPEAPDRQLMTLGKNSLESSNAFPYGVEQWLTSGGRQALSHLVHYAKPDDPYRLLAASIAGGNKHAIPQLVRLLKIRDNPAGWWDGWHDMYNRIGSNLNSRGFQSNLSHAETARRIARIAGATRSHKDIDGHMAEDAHNHFLEHFNNVLLEHTAGMKRPEDINWTPYEMFADHLEENGLGHYADLVRSELANVMEKYRPRPRGKKQFSKTGQVKKFDKQLENQVFTPEEQGFLSKAQPATIKQFDTTSKKSIKNQEGSLPTVEELKNLAYAGESVKGEYGLTHKTLTDLLGPKMSVGWVALNTVLSPQTRWEEHTTGATRLLGMWNDRGAPHEDEDLDQLMKEFHEVRKPNGTRAYSLLDRNKIAKSKFILKNLEYLAGEGGKVARASELGKTVDFMRAFFDKNGVPLDTHMSKLLKPYDRKKIIQTVREAKPGAASNLLRLQLKMVSKPQLYLAYKKSVASAANQLGWEPREVQETVWTALLAVMVAKEFKTGGLFGGDEKILDLLDHQAVREGWNIHNLLDQKEVQHELGRSGVSALDVQTALAKHSEERKKIGTPTRGRISKADPGVIESISERLPSVGKAVGSSIRAKLRELYKTKMRKSKQKLFGKIR